MSYKICFCIFGKWVRDSRYAEGKVSGLWLETSEPRGGVPDSPTL